MKLIDANEEPFNSSVVGLIIRLWECRILVVELIKREVLSRYRGSVFGILWSFFNPLIMLAIYTFVFSSIFRSRWPGFEEQDKLSFTINVFAGLIIVNFFNECLNRAPFLILSNSNYVTKVVFPLEVLGIVAAGTSLFHALINIILLLIVQTVIYGKIHVTIILLPLVFLPLILLTLGCAWFLSALGVYFRDIGQLTGLIGTSLQFLSPVFYPVSAVPNKYQELFKINPITIIIENLRDILILGIVPNLYLLFLNTIMMVIISYFGFSFFQKMRKGFGDVI